MLGTNEDAWEWIEEVRLQNSPHCLHCGNLNVHFGINVGVFHKLSANHLDKPVADLTHRRDSRDRHNIDQIDHIVRRMPGIRPILSTPIADNELLTGAVLGRELCEKVFHAEPLR